MQYSFAVLTDPNGMSVHAEAAAHGAVVWIMFPVSVLSIAALNEFDTGAI